MEKSAERAGISLADYKRWASGGKVLKEVRDAILSAAPNEPGQRVILDKGGSPIGIEEFTIVPKPAKTQERAKRGR